MSFATHARSRTLHAARSIARRWLRPAGLLLVIAALADCVPPVTVRRSDGRAVVLDPVVARAAATRAKARLDSALRSGSVARVLSLLDSGVVVVMPDGDSARGRDDVAAWLNRRFGDAREARADFFAGPQRLCLDGAVEFDTDVSFFLRRTTRADTLFGKVRIRWRDHGAGDWRLARLDIGGHPASSSPPDGVCPPTAALELAQRRLRVAFGLPFSPVVPVSKWSSEGALASQGFKTGTLPPAVNLQFPEMLRSGDKFVGPYFGYLSVRGPLNFIGPRWTGDLIVGVGDFQVRSYGYRASTGSRVRLDTDVGMTVAGLLQQERGSFRFGAGLAVLTADFTAYEDRTDTGLGIPLVVQKSHVSAPAVLLEAGYTRALAGNMFWEARIWQRLGARVDYPKFGAVTGGGRVALDDMSVTLGIGVAY